MNDRTLDTRKADEHQFTSHDGQVIFYRRWAPIKENTHKRAIILLHRGHEHSGRVAHIVTELGFPDTVYFAWDARGNGRTEGPRGYSPSFAALIQDLDVFVKHLSEQYDIPISNMTVLAQSVGAVIASAWVHDYAPQIKALILASPAFKIKLYVPFALGGIALWQKIAGQFYVKSYVKGKHLSHNPERIQSYHTDPLVVLPIASNILLELNEVSRRVVSDSGAIHTPTLLLMSGADFVVKHSPQHAFFDGLSSLIKEKHILPGFYHDTLGELEREKAFVLIRSFMDKVEKSALKPYLLDADKKGYTFDEYQTLLKPLPLWHPKRWYYGTTQILIKILGQYSAKGVKVGVETGFDSGSSLDYVYENKAQGVGLLGLLGLGKLIDKGYLESVGWKGIRVRKIHLEAAINTCIQQLRTKSMPVRLVDIASGHGRYILDAIVPQYGSIEQVLLRDYSLINVQAGSQMILDRKLEAKVKFVEGDAFNQDSLAQLSPAPTLAVVSGLYELFPDNVLLESSLVGLSQAIPKGGYLVYTNQPWHPQVEVIARTLSSHQKGKPWVMRRRSQAEMDQLVAAAGFEKIDQKIDQWGIFTVSVAIRID